MPTWMRSLAPWDVAGRRVAVSARPAEEVLRKLRRFMGIRALFCLIRGRCGEWFGESEMRAFGPDLFGAEPIKAAPHECRPTAGVPGATCAHDRQRGSPRVHDRDTDVHLGATEFTSRDGPTVWNPTGSGAAQSCPLRRSLRPDMPRNMHRELAQSKVGHRSPAAEHETWQPLARRRARIAVRLPAGLLAPSIILLLNRGRRAAARLWLGLGIDGGCT